MAAPKVRETELYAPVKAMLEGQGYEVKSEIGAADVVAVRGTEDPIIVELETGSARGRPHQGGRGRPTRPREDRSANDGG